MYRDDTRLIQPGDWFVALEGIRYVREAYERGAQGVIIDEYLDQDVIAHLPISVVRIPQLRQRLAHHSQQWFSRSDQIDWCAVTGTAGKTSTAYWLHQILAFTGRPSVYVGTLGTSLKTEKPILAPLTTPTFLQLSALSHLAYDQHIQQGCVEISSHALAQERVHGLKVTRAIFTNLSHEHLDYHGTMQNYAASKKRLFTDFPLQYAIVQVSDPWSTWMIQDLSPGCSLYRYGLNEEAEIKGIWHAESAFLKLTIQTPQGSWILEKPWPNALVHVWNSLAVTAAACTYGLTRQELENAWEFLQPVPGRMEVFEEAGRRIWVDYAHKPAALEAILVAGRKTVKPGQRLWCLFGCGGERDTLKRPIMARYACTLADEVIFTEDNTRQESLESIFSDMLAGCDRPVHLVPDRAEAIAWLIQHMQSGDLGLVLGRGAEAYLEKADQRYPFDDRVIVKRLLCTIPIIGKKHLLADG